MPILALALVALDRIIKLWAASALAEGVREGLPGVFQFHLAQNTGASFSMFSGNTRAIIWFTGVALAALTTFLLTRGRRLSPLTRAGLWVLAAGGLGNLIDRVAYGYVVDFIELTFMHFAVFNVADMCVCVGAGLACIGLFASGGKSGEKKEGA